MSHTVARQEKLTEIEDVAESVVEDQPVSLDPEHVLATEHKTPSWFSRDLSTEAGTVLADRYRASRPESNLMVETPGPEAYEAYRRRLEEKFSLAHSVHESAPEPLMADRRPTLPLSDIHGRRRLYEQEQREHMVKTAPYKKPNSVWKPMLTYSTIAILIGTVGGFSFANMDKISGYFHNSAGTSQLTLASLADVAAKPAPVVHETTIQKKAVSMASLDVNDVRGSLNSMIPLMLRAQAAEGKEPIALKVMGVPQDAYLTAGVETTKGNWLVKPADIAGVNLVVPQSSAQQFNMEVAAVEEKTGALAAPIKAMNVKLDGIAAAVTPPLPLTQTGDGKAELAASTTATDVAATIAPANAPPETATIQSNQAAPIPIASPQASDLISKADGLLNSGDIASARQFYLQADNLGDAKGAYGVGRTYDPQVYAALNVQGLKPDPAKAADWYQKAIDGGVDAAKNALSGLQTAQ
jgi:hypothetical protein